MIYIAVMSRSLTPGDEVLLSTKNINLRGAGERHSTPKLMPEWVGPFKVIESVGKLAYKLELPYTMKFHPVFHVCVLKPLSQYGAGAAATFIR